MWYLLPDKKVYKKENPGIRCILQKDDKIESNYAYFPIVVNEGEFGHNRNEPYDFLWENNIFSRKYFFLLTSDQACFKNKYKKAELDVARSLAKKILVLPLYADMEVNVVDHIAQLIQQKCRNEKIVCRIMD